MKGKKIERWNKEDASDVFDILNEFFMLNANKNIPMSIYVSNYLGDISKGRKITLDKPKDAFPSFFKK